MYLIFASGSTGRPKGVEVTAENLDHFWEWMCALYGDCGNEVFFNRSPCSFDVSIIDVVMGIDSGAMLFALAEEHEVNFADVYAAFRQSGMGFWVSTPSFVDMCLCDKAFSSEMLPSLKTFYFQGINSLLTAKTIFSVC